MPIEANFHFPLILLATLTAALHAEQVLELTDADFYPRIAEYEYTLALFYAPWCKRSKNLLPKYFDAANELLRHSPPISLIKIDCTEESDDICEKFAKDTYPTLKFFKNGEVISDYNGPHTSYGIIKYAKAQVRPTSQEISLEDVEELIKSMEEPFVVGYFAVSSSMKQVFLEVAEKLKVKLQFFHNNTTLDNAPSVVLYQPQYMTNKFENASFAFTGDPDASSLHHFIVKHLHGLVGIRKLDNQEDFREPLVIIYFTLDYKLNPKRTNYWRNRVLQIAKEFENNNVTFAMSPSNQFANSDLLAVGIDFVEHEKPIVVAKKFGNKKYLLQDKFSKESLRKFVIDFLAGNLEPVVKSEPIPEHQAEPVLVAVAKSFEKIVEQNGKDTLIKFYAPWCGHCKTLAPAYKELAEKLKNENVAVVEMDAEANDVPYPYTVAAYPTIYWAPKDSKNSPVKYEGGRAVKDFIKFIAREASEELIGWDRNGNPKDVKNEL